VSESVPLRDRLLTWLEKEGYPLEMRVAALLRERTRFAVRQGWHYTDPESLQSREIDVVATDREVNGLAAVHFFIECKAPGKGKPWVLFVSKQTMENFNRLYAFGFISRDGHSLLAKALLSSPDSSARAQALPWFWHHEPVGYSLVQAFEGNTDAPYAAALSAVKAALSAHGKSPQHNSPERFRVTFPVVVTSTPLFECLLGSDGKPELREIERGFWFFQQQIGSASPVKVAIVSEKGLTSYLEECVQASNTVMDIFKPDVEEAWQELQKRTQSADG
jgi:hypothetical protein